jgi:type II secretory pathway pseudopilin PulG
MSGSASARVAVGRCYDGGFTYIGILVAVVLLGIALAAAGTLWTITTQRDRETQLLFIGHAFRAAIQSYYATGHQLPRDLDDLILDQRFPQPRHHLRRIYIDPMTGHADWQLIRDPDGGIFGVYSSSQQRPLKRANFDPEDAQFDDAECYCDWHFEINLKGRMGPVDRHSGIGARRSE